MLKNMRKRNPTNFVNASRLVVLQDFVIRVGFVFPVNASRVNASRASVSPANVSPANVSRDIVILVAKNRKRPVSQELVSFL